MICLVSDSSNSPNHRTTDQGAWIRHCPAIPYLPALYTDSTVPDLGNPVKQSTTVCWAFRSFSWRTWIYIMLRDIVFFSFSINHMMKNNHVILYNTNPSTYSVYLGLGSNVVGGHATQEKNTGGAHIRELFFEWLAHRQHLITDPSILI